MSKRKTIFLIGLLTLVLAACAPATEPTAFPLPPTSEPAEPAPPPSTDAPPLRGESDAMSKKDLVGPGQAQVNSVEVVMMESFPVQVSLIVRGDLPDGCTTIDQIVQRREGNTFFVSIGTARPPDAMCTTALVPFEEEVPLDVAGLAAGKYDIDVNGTSAVFDLLSDNSMQTEPKSEKQQMIYREARVNEITIRRSATESNQVEVVARGDLPDGCTTISEALVTSDEQGFYVTLITERPADAMCITVLTPYEEVILLDVAARAAGSYTVQVNNVSQSFDLP